MELPVAHAAHWVVWILYAAPVLVVLGSILTGALRARRERGSTPGAGSTRPPRSGLAVRSRRSWSPRTPPRSPR